MEWEKNKTAQEEQLQRSHTEAKESLEVSQQLSSNSSENNVVSRVASLVRVGCCALLLVASHVLFVFTIIALLLVASHVLQRQYHST